MTHAWYGSTVSIRTIPNNTRVYEDLMFVPLTKTPAITDMKCHDIICVGACELQRRILYLHAPSKLL